VARAALALATAILLAPGCATRRLARQGDEFLAAGRTTHAARCYAQACERRPERGDLQLRLAAALLLDGRPDDAEGPARRALALEEPGADLALADALMRTRHLDEARTLIEAAVRRSPQDAHALELAAWEQLLRRDPAAADTMRRSAAAAPDLRRLATLAWILARTGAVEEAQEQARVAAERARTADGTDVDALGDIAAVLLLAGRAEESRKEAFEVQSYAADVVDRWQGNAARAQEAGDVEGALRMTVRVLALRPHDGELLGTVGTLLLACGDLAQAERFLQAALAADAFRASWERGMAYMEGNAVATMGFQDARAAELGLALARVWSEQGRALDAARARRAALVIQGGATADAWVEVAALFEKARALQSAVLAAQEAVRLQPDHLAALMILVRSFRAAGDLGQAIGYGRMAWAAAHGDPQVALALGELYERREDPAAARDLYLEALRAHPRLAPLEAALRRVEH
jgi:Flp pilus assembly protein TadD